MPFLLLPVVLLAVLALCPTLTAPLVCVLVLSLLCLCAVRYFSRKLSLQISQLPLALLDSSQRLCLGAALFELDHGKPGVAVHRLRHTIDELSVANRANRPEGSGGACARQAAASGSTQTLASCHEGPNGRQFHVE